MMVYFKRGMFQEFKGLGGETHEKTSTKLVNKNNINEL